MATAPSHDGTVTSTLPSDEYTVDGTSDYQLAHDLGVAHRWRALLPKLWSTAGAAERRITCFCSNARPTS